MREVSWILLPSTYLPFYYKATKIPYLIYYIQFILSNATTSHVPTISIITIMKIPKHLHSKIVTLLNTLLISTQIKRREEPFGTLCLHPSLLHPDKIQKDDTWDLVLGLNQGSTITTKNPVFLAERGGTGETGKRKRRRKKRKEGSKGSSPRNRGQRGHPETMRT